MAELYWFPVYPQKWLAAEGTTQMLPEQEGAFFRLLCAAWGDGRSEPSLPTDDLALANMSRLGSRWKKLGPLVRAQFDERDGRLYNDDLSTTWREQQAKHAEIVRKASAGGKAKAERRRAAGSASANASGSATGSSTGSASASSTASASASASGRAGEVLEECPSSAELELEGTVDRTLTGPGLPVPAPGGARARGAARAPALVGDGVSAAWRSMAPEPDPERLRLEAEYFRQLRARADGWASENPEEAQALERETRAEMGLPLYRDLSAFQDRSLREHLLTRIREKNSWPDAEQWIADLMTIRAGDDHAA